MSFASRFPTPDGRAEFPSPPPFANVAPVAPTNATPYAMSVYERELRRWREDRDAYDAEVTRVGQGRITFRQKYREERRKEEERLKAEAKGKRKRTEEDRGEGSSKGKQRRRDDESSDDEVSLRIFLSLLY